MKNQNEEMITVNVDWRGVDCIGYDVWVAKCSTISRRVRLFLKQNTATSPTASTGSLAGI